MPNVLTINGGSSSIRFAVFAADRPPRRLLRGQLERIGSDEAHLSVEQDGRPPVRIGAGGKKSGAATEQSGAAIGVVLDWLESQPVFATIAGVGHRIVHGMLHTEPALISAKLVGELRDMIPFDPEHLPREIEFIEVLRRRYPTLPQVACFDTAFHRGMPRVATQLPIPRRYAEQGVQRYGFHGLSYTYLMQELARLGDPAAVRGRVILAHLGSGASIAAVLDGKSIDTSMGFTPTAGLVMGTRSGDLDPGLMSYLALKESMTATQFQTLVNHESGMLGVSQSSADVRDLLAREAGDPRAAEALALFCYQARKWIGSFAAALGGLDTLVFAGGIGENAAAVRKRICEGLGFLGIELDEAANTRHAPCISTALTGTGDWRRVAGPGTGSVVVRVIRTDEESVIAAASLRVLGLE